MPEEKLTRQQQKALHLYFRLIAQRLNDAGLTMRKVLAPSVDIEWTDALVKRYLWKAIQEVQLEKRSTTELNKTGDINIVYETLNRFLAQHGIHVGFPSLEDMLKYYDEKTTT